jgi:hypothetical protein
MQSTATRAPMARRLIDLTEDEFDAKLTALAVALDGEGSAVAPDPERAMARITAAEFLDISLSKLDLLSRRERDPLPYYVVGESRRYLRPDVVAWVRRQREVAA